MFFIKKVRKYIIYDTRLNGINQNYMTCTEITQPSFNQILNFMKIDTHETKWYYTTKYDKHFQIETEIVWAWSVNFNYLIDNVHKTYERKLCDLINSFKKDTNTRTRKQAVVHRDDDEDINVGKHKYTE